jgi:hypothetical protein
MKRWLLFLGVFMFLVSGITADAQARRGIPIPIVWGSGEKMTEMGELPPELSRGIAEKTGNQVTVAFLYERTHVLYLDVWTWNGRHVIHSGNNYWQPDSTQWRDMIGEDPSAKYGKPILYRIPLLPALLVVLILGNMVRQRFFNRDPDPILPRTMT